MEHANRRFKELKARILQYNPNCDFWLLDKAFNIALVAHSDQVRKSGELFVMHPLEVGHILADMEIDIDAIVAALLHDTVEDTKYTAEDIRDFFGEHIAALVEGVTKLTKLPYCSFEEQQIENLRKMFLAMSKDIRVILIKLSDRLHNMRTLKSMKPAKQLIISRETMEVYAPIAHRLGMSKIKWELEDLSLRYLDPVAYAEITSLIQDKRAEREKNLSIVQATIMQKMKEIGITGHVEGRVKHFYSVYRKIYAQNMSIDGIYDLLAVRIIVDTTKECYEVFGMIHELFKPIPGRVKDYISMPKNNGYQSLHTSLMGSFGKPFEVQIRTWEMHRIAEVGIAAHWKYKEGKFNETGYDNSLEWVRNLIDVQKDFTDAEEFMRTLRIDLFADEVFVYSPKGEVIKLPIDSCPVDYAYAIHSAIGNRMTGAKINGKIASLDYKLGNGDIVEIITSNVAHGPKRDWLKFIKTNTAKKKINEWFKKENREEHITRGKEILLKELKRSGLPASLLNDHEAVAPVLTRYSIQNYDDLLAIVGYGGFSPARVIFRLKEKFRADEEAAKAKQRPAEESGHASPTTHIFVPSTHTNDYNITVDGITNCQIRLSRCCNPVYGDEIVGYITRGRGVSVHRSDCINLSNLADKAEEQGRFIDIWWSDNTGVHYLATLQLVFPKRPGLVMDIVKTLHDNNILLQAINTREAKNNLTIIDINIEIEGKDHLQNAINKLSRIKGLTSIKRTKQ